MPTPLLPRRGEHTCSTLAACAQGAHRGAHLHPLQEFDGYTEKGDPLLTFNVSAQTLDTLTGNVGVQFRTQFLAGGNLVSPFLNVSLEHQFGDDTRTATTNLTQAPLLPILSPVPSFDTRTYGRIEGGVTFQMGPNVSSTINAASTFARDEGNDYRISAGLNYKF